MNEIIDLEGIFTPLATQVGIPQVIFGFLDDYLKTNNKEYPCLFIDMPTIESSFIDEGTEQYPLTVYLFTLNRNPQGKQATRQERRLIYSDLKGKIKALFKKVNELANSSTYPKLSAIEFKYTPDMFATSDAELYVKCETKLMVYQSPCL